MGRLRVVLVRLFFLLFSLHKHTLKPEQRTYTHTHVPSKQMLMHFFSTFNLFYFSPRDVFTTHEANLSGGRPMDCRRLRRFRLRLVQVLLLFSVWELFFPS